MRPSTRQLMALCCLSTLITLNLLPAVNHGVQAAPMEQPTSTVTHWQEPPMRWQQSPNGINRADYTGIQLRAGDLGKMEAFFHGGDEVTMDANGEPITAQSCYDRLWPLLQPGQQGFTQERYQMLRGVQDRMKQAKMSTSFFPALEATLIDDEEKHYKLLRDSLKVYLDPTMNDQDRVVQARKIFIETGDYSPFYALLLIVRDPSVLEQLQSLHRAVNDYLWFNAGNAYFRRYMNEDEEYGDADFIQEIEELMRNTLGYSVSAKSSRKTF